MGAPDAGEHGRDMAVLAVEGQGPLGEIPDERREPPLDRGDGPWPAACALGAGRERREIEADAFGVGERLSDRGPGGRASVDSRASRRRRRGWCFWRSPRGRRRGRCRRAARALRVGRLRPGVRPLAGAGGSFPVIGAGPSGARPDLPASGLSAGRRSGAVSVRRAPLFPELTRLASGAGRMLAPFRSDGGGEARRPRALAAGRRAVRSSV